MEDPRMAMAKHCPNKAAVSRQPLLGKHAPSLRQCALLVLVAVLATACGKDNGIESPSGPGQIDYLKGFVGGVAADEPRAALVARNILSAGGSAADAAVAAALAYTVTYPAGAGLGSGGMCVASDPVTKRVETIEFPAIAPKDGGPVAIPGMVRGLGLLQGRYGRLRWEAVVAPAEQLARFGEPASRAFVQAAVEAQPPVTESPGLLPVWGTRTGVVPQEGERRYQPTLGNTLARLRTVGPAELYQGMLAHQLVADMNAAGAKITIEELRGYTVELGKPIEVPFENSITLYTTNTTAGGAVAAWLLEQSFSGTSLFSSTSVRGDKFAESLGQAYRSDPATLQMNGFGSASVSVIDRKGSAVSCAFSMGTAYGARRTGRDTGILFANVPGVAGDEAPYLTALVGFNKRNSQSFFAAGGAGGAPAASAVAYSVLQAAISKAQKEPAVTAQAAPRLFQANPQATLLVEPNTPGAIYKGMADRGVTVNQIGRLGRVTLAYCLDGLPRDPSGCSFAADPRGYGLAAGRQY